MKSRKADPAEKGGGNNRLIYRMISILCIVVAAGALVYIGYFFQEYWVTESESRKAREAYDKAVAALAATQPEITPWPPGPPPPLPTPLPSNPAPPEAANRPDADAEELERQAERSRRLANEVVNRAFFAELLAANPDYLGYITIDGLNLQYPYVQGEDNEKYLNTSFEGKRNSHGAIFLSAYNDRLLMDRNNVLFGHYTETGTMFTQLRRYNDIKTWERAPVIELDSLHGKTTWLVFSAYITEPDYGYVGTGANREHFSTLLEEFHIRSLFHTNIEVTESDRVLTLSTCAYEFNDARFAVHARELRPGEDLDAILAARTIEKNPSPKPYDAPMQVNFSDVPANRAAAMVHLTTGRTYYFQAAEESGMEYYIGIGRNTQGPYTGFSGPMTPASTLSAVYAALERRSWIAFDGYKNTPGIFLLTSRIAAGPYGLSRKTPVTPAGVNARHPLLALDEEERLWLVYAVTETADGVSYENMYRMSLFDGYPGTPELILTREGGADVRPAGLFWVGQKPLLLWQEAAQKKLFCLWLDEEGEQQPYALATSGDHDRVSFYSAANDTVRMLTEKGGKLSAGTPFDLLLIPPPAPPPEPPPTEGPPPEPDAPPDPVDPTPEPTPEPTSAPEPDGPPEDP
ncbi:MAG: class B sortase [Oscillospiraceae bacterium]|nr:class B sortase [Oscillospiraceae bacterium]